MKKRINLIARILQVPAGSQNIKVLLNFFLLSYLTYSQIWLYLLVNECQFSYIKNWKLKILLDTILWRAHQRGEQGMLWWLTNPRSWDWCNQLLLPPWRSKASEKNKWYIKVWGGRLCHLLDHIIWSNLLMMSMYS